MHPDHRHRTSTYRIEKHDGKRAQCNVIKTIFTTIYFVNIIDFCERAIKKNTWVSVGCEDVYIIDFTQRDGKTRTV